MKYEIFSFRMSGENVDAWTVKGVCPHCKQEVQIGRYVSFECAHKALLEWHQNLRLASHPGL